MVRSTFEKIIKSPVDILGSFCGLHDILFVKQIEALFNSRYYQYTHIFIQMGHHGIRGENDELYKDENYIRFHDDTVSLINYLKQYSANVILLTNFLSLTPCPSRFSSGIKILPVLLWRKFFGEKIDHSWSDVVIRKNEIIKEIADHENSKFCDINGVMLSKSQGLFPEYIH